MVSGKEAGQEAARMNPFEDAEMMHPSFSLGPEVCLMLQDASMAKQQQKSSEDKQMPPKKSKNRQKMSSGRVADKICQTSKKARVSSEVLAPVVLPVDLIDSDSESESDLQEPDTRNRKKSGFVDADARMAIIMKKKASTDRKDKAYAERYYEWRREYGGKLFGVSSSFQKRIQDFNTLEIREFGQHLVYFLQQIVKRDGKVYKATTIKDYLTTFGRLLHEGRNERIRNTGQDEPDINVFEHPFFAAAKEAANKVIADIMASQPRNPDSLNIITDKVIVKVLAAEEFSPSTPNGLLNRVIFYCITNFLIRGGKELWNVVYSDFQMMQDRYGRFIRFMQRPCKNRPGDLNNCKESDLRKPVEVYEEVNEDLYKTFEKYISRLPAVNDGEDVSDRHFLKASKIFVAGGSTCWYAKTNLGWNKIFKVGKIMGNIAGLKITNKTLRHYAVTRARQQGIPDDNLKDLTGHKRAETLRNYDHSGKQAMMAMQASIMPGGKPYAAALSTLQEKLNAPEENVETPIDIPQLVLALGEREVLKVPSKQQVEEVQQRSEQQQPEQRLEHQSRQQMDHVQQISPFSQIVMQRPEHQSRQQMDHVEQISPFSQIGMQQEATIQTDGQLKSLQSNVRPPLANVTNAGVPNAGYPVQNAAYPPRGFSFNFSFY